VTRVELRKHALLDLFSGIGGFSLGLERSGGFRTVAFCEIEPYCRRVLAKHWPEVPCYDDIRTMEAYRTSEEPGHGFIRGRLIHPRSGGEVRREPSVNVGRSSPPHNDAGQSGSAAAQRTNGDTNQAAANTAPLPFARGQDHQNANSGGLGAGRDLQDVRQPRPGRGSRSGGVAGRPDRTGEPSITVSGLPSEEIEAGTMGQMNERYPDIGPIDAICGGFPCQDISIAGKGAGLDGARSGLWSEIARLVGELRPRYVIVENVAALLDRGLGDVLGALAALGYDAEWHCIPAAHVGAAHRRDRVWIVAHPGGEGREGLEPVYSALEREIAAFTQHDNEALGARDALDGSLSGLRAGDGLSVAMERRRLHALGNAVVPQIPELIGRAIMAAERAAA